jgi:hypothetical protein
VKVFETPGTQQSQQHKSFAGSDNEEDVAHPDLATNVLE